MAGELAQATSSIMHTNSGLEIAAYDNGMLSITSLGNPMDGDPLAGSRILYDPNTGTLTHTNRMEITPQGQVNAADNAQTEGQYKVDLQSDNRNPDLTGSSVDVPSYEGNSSSEEGIFHLTSDDGMLEITVYDRGRISQGAVEVQYTNPETGQITKLSADENTATVAEIGPEGVKQSGAIELNSFTENDFRYQPTVAPSVPGMD